MKSFLLWLGLCVVAFGATGGGYHAFLSSSPHRLLVIVDSSFEMQPKWAQVPKLLKQIGQRPYTEFALATEKKPVHQWSAKLSLGRISAYAPRNFATVNVGENAALIAEADRIIFISNAPANSLPALGSVEVLRPE